MLSNNVCVQQWLRTANTCPVCREKVKTSPKPAPARRRPHRDVSAPSETNQGANSSTPENGLNSRPPHTAPQTNNGRPVSFAAMVFDRLMNGDGAADTWPSSSPAAPLPPRDTRRVYLERLRAQQQQHAREFHPPAHAHGHHDVFVEFASPHELPYHLRVPPTSQPGSSSFRPTAGAGTDGPSVRPFAFMLRGQGSDSSISSSSSTSMVVDDVGAGSRRSMGVGTNSGPGSGSGSLYLDAPTMPRRENMFALVPPSSGTFGGASGAAALGLPPPPVPAPLPQSQQQPSFDVRVPPTMVISSSTESSSSREWRSARGGYDTLFNVEASRSPLVSGPPSRPMSVANRLPVEEDSPFEDYVFEWSLRGRLGASSGP